MGNPALEPAEVVAFLAQDAVGFRFVSGRDEGHVAVPAASLVEQLVSLPKPLAWRCASTPDGIMLEAYPVNDDRLRHALAGAKDQAFAPGGILSRLEDLLAKRGIPSGASEVLIEHNGTRSITTIGALREFWTDYLWDEANSAVVIESHDPGTPNVLRLGRSKRISRFPLT
jgi:hypothetical protein